MWLHWDLMCYWDKIHQIEQKQVLRKFQLQKLIWVRSFFQNTFIVIKILIITVMMGLFKILHTQIRISIYSSDINFGEIIVDTLMFNSVILQKIYISEGKKIFIFIELNHKK